MQAVRAGILSLRSSSSSPSAICRSFNATSTSISAAAALIGGARVFSQSAASASSPSALLEKQEVTSRVTDLFRSIPFIDPAKVSPTASFKDDLKLDILDNVEVIIAVEEEFAIDIPENEANKLSTTAHLIDYVAAHPQAK